MQQSHTVKIWDPLVRLLHWGLAASFLIAYLSEDDRLTLHSYAGYLLLGLITLRLVWGLGTRAVNRVANEPGHDDVVLHLLNDKVE